MFPKHKPHTLGFSRFCCISTYYACSYDSDSLPFQQQTPKQRQDSRGCRLYSVVCHLAQTFWNPVPTSGGLRPASFFLKKKRQNDWVSTRSYLFWAWIVTILARLLLTVNHVGVSREVGTSFHLWETLTHALMLRFIPNQVFCLIADAKISNAPPEPFHSGQLKHTTSNQ